MRRTLLAISVMASLAMACSFGVDPRYRLDVRGQARYLSMSEYYNGDLDRFRSCLIDGQGKDCARRAELVGKLLEVSAKAPADAFVQSQVAHALARMGAHEDALAVLDPCSMEAQWFCAALRGHVFAESHRVLEAQSAFDHAIRMMPDSVLCEWTDLSLLVSRKVWSAYKGGSCAERSERLEEFWWLSDPSWVEPGNDREVEHNNRMVWAWLHADVKGRAGGCHLAHRHPHTIQYGKVAATIYLGWCNPERTKPDEGQTYRVIPEAAALLNAFHASADDWPIVPDGNPENYVPANGGLLALEAFQVAFFERGDSLIATVAANVPDHPGFSKEKRRGAVLFLATGPASPPIVSETKARDGRWLFSVDAPRRRYVVSMEAVASEGIGRVRLGHGLPHEVSNTLRLSDLLLFEPTNGALPDSLGAAQPLMRGSNVWRAGETMGVFLEVYGADSIVSFLLSVQLERQRGLLERIVDALWIGGGAQPVRVQWSQTGEDGQLPVSFTVDLRDASQGDYTLRVSVGSSDAERLLVEKAVRIEGGIAASVLPARNMRSAARA